MEKDSVVEYVKQGAHILKRFMLVRQSDIVMSAIENQLGDFRADLQSINAEIQILQENVRLF